VTPGARFVDALQYSIPYISHLMAVASLVIEHGGSEDVAIAALLHDSLEDHPEAVSVDGLKALFGSEVAEIVVSCSDVVGHGDREQKPPWKQRKQAYLDHLETAPPAVLLVALADKVHNARATLADLRAADDDRVFWRRFNSTKSEQFWYYRSLVRLFDRRFPVPLAQELNETVAAIRAEDARRVAVRRDRR
jgi:(p)ppGpp synthase/HD superfamily hydrolase